jgi:hypothetical protein
MDKKEMTKDTLIIFNKGESKQGEKYLNSIYPTGYDCAYFEPTYCEPTGHLKKD